MSTPSPLPADYVHAPIVVREAARLHIERAPAAKGRAWLEKALADAGVTGKFNCFLSLAPISSSNVSQTSSIWSFVVYWTISGAKSCKKLSGQRWADVAFEDEEARDAALTVINACTGTCTLTRLFLSMSFFFFCVVLILFFQFQMFLLFK